MIERLHGALLACLLAMLAAPQVLAEHPAMAAAAGGDSTAATLPEQLSPQGLRASGRVWQSENVWALEASF